MCSASKPKTTEPETPDILVTARDGQQVGQSSAQRKKSGLRVDLNNSSYYSGLTIPRG